MMRLLVAWLAMAAAGQDYAKWPISSGTTTTCSMNAASIICAYEVRVEYDVVVRELYVHIGPYTAGTMTVRLAFQNDNSGVPSGVDLAYVDSTPTGSWMWVGGQLSADVELIAGQTYWQVVRYISYGSGSIDIKVPQPPLVSAAYVSRVIYRRYNGSTWSTGAAGAGMLMVDAHGWTVDPVPVIQSSSGTTSYTKTCRAVRPMEIVGIIELRRASGQAASYSVTAQSGSGSGYVAAGVPNDEHPFAYVWFDQPVRVGAGQSYTIQRTSTSAHARLASNTGLPARLQHYFSPLCSGATVMVWPIERLLRVVR